MDVKMIEFPTIKISRDKFNGLCDFECKYCLFKSICDDISPNEDFKVTIEVEK
jgi:hypothetical protein